MSVVVADQLRRGAGTWHLQSGSLTNNTSVQPESDQPTNSLQPLRGCLWATGLTAVIARVHEPDIRQSPVPLWDPRCPINRSKFSTS